MVRGFTLPQVATQLTEAGHRVGVLVPAWIVLTRFKRTVHTLHRVPSYGRDPWRWLDAAHAVARGYGYEVLFPA